MQKKVFLELCKNYLEAYGAIKETHLVSLLPEIVKMISANYDLFKKEFKKCK